ncbi:MAG: TetR family transcriptional regulator [Pseudomonadota bacterium]
MHSVDAQRFTDSIRFPTRANAKATFEKIITAGQIILEEAGLEAVNSNIVAERAGVTAPVFYHYFKNKHALLNVMADRLLLRQNEAYQRWETESVETRDDLRAHALLVLQETYRVTASFTGSRALIVSLRAVPELAGIRIAANQHAAEFYADRCTGCA